MRGLVFHVLGDVCVSGAAGVVRFNSGRERTIVSLLVVNANQAVALEKIVDVLWEEDPPKTARDQIYICISSIRRTLKEFDPGYRIETRSPGYRLVAGQDEIDVQVFDARLHEALAEVRRGPATPAAAARLRAAVTDWPGEPFPGVESSVIRSFAELLSQRRLAAIEECLRIEIGLGRHAPAAEELAELVVEHPLRAGFWFHYITVLHKLGRRADALLAYRRATREMTSALGVEPDPALNRLHAEILRDARPEEDQERGDPPTRRRAGELPPDLPDFAGRHRESAFLRRRALAGGIGVCRPVLVCGPHGGGKSALAVHVAHQLEGAFPDGRLYAKFRESDNAADVLSGFLLALDVADGALPADVDARVALYRRLTAGKRILVIVDNVVGAWQVHPVVPAAGRNAMFLVSRSRLTGLPEIERLSVTTPDRGRASFFPSVNSRNTAPAPGDGGEPPRAADRRVTGAFDTDALWPQEALEEASRVLDRARLDLSRAATAIAHAEEAIALAHPPMA